MKKLTVGTTLILALAFASAASATDLALWTFETSAPSTAGPHAAEGGANAGPASPALGWHADSGVGYTNPVGNGSTESFSANYWAIGDYFEFATSTAGYQNITFTWHQRPSSTGPDTFDVFCSNDGTTWTEIASDVVNAQGSWTSATEKPEFIHGPVSAPAAMNDQAVVYFRVVCDVAPGSTGGTSRVDNVLIAGTALSQTGACCVGSTCTPNQTVTACAGMGGMFMGDGTTCSPNPCSAGGACCVGETCTVVTAADCTTAGGTYQGDGTLCSPNPCLVCIDITAAKALPDDSEVILCDVIISNDIDLNQGSTATMHVQEEDGSGGYTLFSFDSGDIAGVLAQASVGDKIKLWGVTDSYQGLAELTPPFQVEFIETVGAPAPTVVTSDDIATNGEALESMLVEVHCAQFRDGGSSWADHVVYIADTANGPVNVYISSAELGISGTIPICPVNVVGILGERSGEYRIQLRSIADIVEDAACTGVGACCDSFNNCTEVDCETCYAAGGSGTGPLGTWEPGSVCTPNPCVPPYGACCLEGVCYDVIDIDGCDALGGCWQGDYSECASDPCNPPAEAGDLALGLSDSSPDVTLRHVRDYDADGFGEPIGNWSAFPYVQSVEFDNYGSVLRNAHGNLLGLNFGVALSEPPSAGQGGALYNLATDGSNCGEELFSFRVGEGTIEANVTNLSVSNDNDYIAVWGSSDGKLHILSYDAGTTVRTGSGASAGSQIWEYTPSGALSGKGQGTTWYQIDDGGTPVDVVLMANVNSLSAGLVQLHKVEFRPGGSPELSGSTVATLPFANDGQNVSATDIEYNPAISPYVFVMVSFYGESSYTFLAAVDPSTWQPVIFTETSAPFLDLSTASETSREIALGPDGYLYWSMFSAGSTQHVARIDVSGSVTPLADITAADAAPYHYANSYSSYNGMDIAHGGAALSGACCLNGGCTMSSQAACEGAGGTFSGAGTACWPNDPCIQCMTIMEAKAGSPGDQVMFCGLVISSIEDLNNSSSSMSFFAQHPDNTGGVMIYGSNDDVTALLGIATVGDSIDIQGEADFYAGVFQINAYAAPVIMTNTGTIGVSPVVIPADTLNDNNPAAEVFESQLVTIECVEFAEEPGAVFAYQNYTVTTVDGQTSFTVRIATEMLELIGQPIPDYPVNITGIVGQYSSDPWTTGYQLQPRFIADIVENEECGGGEVCLGDSNCDGVVSWRDIDFFVAAMNDNVQAWEDMFGGTAPCTFANNDVNKDGTVSWRDIDPLVGVMNKTCPTGACCYGIGQCVVTDEAGCDLAGGTFYAGQVCSEVSCE